MAESSVDIVIRGRDEASAEIRRIYQEMKQLGTISDQSRERLAAASETIREQNSVFRLLSTSTRVQYSDALLLARGLSQVGSIASHVTSMITAYNVAAIRVTEAQRDYQEALEKTGPASERTQEAFQRLKQAQQDQQTMMASLIFQIPGLIAQFIYLAGAMQAAGFAAKGFWASLGGPLGIGLLAISALAGGAALLSTWSSTQNIPRVPSGQTRPGEMAQITRTGLMVGHAGETIGRGIGGLSISGPFMSIGKIEMNPEGMSPEAMARAFGKEMQARLRTLTTSIPM